jgi:hypothetical protein
LTSDSPAKRIGPAPGNVTALAKYELRKAMETYGSTAPASSPRAINNLVCFKARTGRNFHALCSRYNNMTLTTKREKVTCPKCRASLPS